MEVYKRVSFRFENNVIHKVNIHKVSVKLPHVLVECS